MFRHKKIKCGRAQLEALEMGLAAKRLIVLRGRRGYVMCGYLNLQAAQKLRDAAVKITGVSTIEEALEAKVLACTTCARRLGIYPGQPIKETLKLIA